MISPAGSIVDKVAKAMMAEIAKTDDIFVGPMPVEGPHVYIVDGHVDFEALAQIAITVVLDELKAQDKP